MFQTWDKAHTIVFECFCRMFVQCVRLASDSDWKQLISTEWVDDSADSPCVYWAFKARYRRRAES
jgi:hypothetical protein